MKKNLIAVFGLLGLMLLTPLAPAQTTWSVIQAGGGDFTTLADAVASAIDGDTISFDDGATTTYTETVNLAGKALTIQGNNTTIFVQAANGAIGSANGATLVDQVVINGRIDLSNDVEITNSTIQGTASNGVVCNSTSLVMTNCIVQGFPNNGININSGSVELNSVTVQNTGTAGAIRGAVRHGAGTGPITLNNCNLINNNSHGISMSAADTATITLNNTNVRNNTDANIHSRDDGAEGPAALIANGGIIDGALLVRGNTTAAGGSGNHSFTLNNVQLGSVGGATYVNGPLAGFEMTWNDCTIIAGLGGVGFFLTQDVTININGSEGNLFDVGAFYDNGGAIFVRALAGNINFDYVTMDNLNFNIFDCTFAGPLLGQVDLTISNSEFPNGSGIVNMVALDGSAQPVNSPFGTTFTAIDSSWTGDTGQGVKVAVRDDGNNLPSTMTLIRTTLSGGVEGGRTMYLISASDTLIANDSTFDGTLAADGTSIYSNMFLTEGRQIFTGCTIRNILGGMTPNATADFVFDDCTFTAVGDILYRMFTAGSSMTFRNMTMDATMAYAAPIGRATNGVLSFENVVFDGFGPVYNNEAAEAASYVGGFTVNMDQCEYRSLSWPLDIGGVDPNDYGTGSSVTFNATNTLFQANPALGWVIRVLPPAGAVADGSTVNLTHCTFYGGTALAYMDVGTSGTVVSDYSLYDGLNEGQAIFTTPLQSISGTANLLNISEGVNGMNSTNLTNSIFGVDPLLGPDGRLTGESPAGGAAIGSTATVDVDGQPRPLNGTVADIGADEDFSVPVELSGFEVL